jgi:hypothetical protein
VNAQRYKGLLYFVFVLACFGLFYPVNSLLSWDQTLYFLHAKYFGGQAIGYNELNFRPILLSLLLSPFTKIISNVYFYKIIGPLFGVLLIFYSYLLAQKFLTRTWSLLAIVLIASNGVLQYESKFLLTDIPSASLLVAGTYYLFFANSHKSFLLSGLFLSGSILMRYGNLYYFLVLLIYLFWNCNLRNIVYFLLGSLTLLLPHQLYFYFEYNTFVDNFVIARFEGVRNAQYSWLKVLQIFTFLGPLSFILLVLSIIKSPVWKLLIIVITGLVFVPFNQDNSRFLIPILTFSVIMILTFVSAQKKNVIKLLIVLIVFESLLLVFYWRSKILPTNERNLTNVELTSQYITNEINDINRIITNYYYPDFALHTNKIINVPLQQVSSNEDFYFILPALTADKNVLIVTQENGMPDPEYLRGLNFQHIKSIHGFELFKLPLDFDITPSIYRASFIYTKLEKYPQGSGLLRMGLNSQIKDLKFNYKPKKIKLVKYKKCFEKTDITITNMNQGFKIVASNKQQVIIDYIPQRLGACVNDDNQVIQIVFDRLNLVD